MPRRLRLYPAQLILMPILMLLPVLALGGWFDEAREQTTASAEGLRVRVDYPARLRHGQSTTLRVRVENLSDRPLGSAVVALDSAYLAGFENISFVPEPTHPYGFEFIGLAPGEAGVLHGQMSAGSPWRIRGVIEVTAGNGEAARVPIDTFILP